MAEPKTCAAQEVCSQDLQENHHEPLQIEDVHPIEGPEEQGPERETGILINRQRIEKAKHLRLAARNKYIPAVESVKNLFIVCPPEAVPPCYRETR